MMTEKANVRSFKSYGSVIKILLLFMGLWPIEKPKFFYRLLPFMVGTAYFVVTSAAMNFALFHRHNLTIALKGVTISLSYLCTIIKVACYVIHREKLIELHRTMNDFFEGQKKKNELLSIVLAPIFYFRRLSVSLSCCSLSVVTTYFVTPVIIMLKQYNNGIRPIRHLMPYPTLYPYITEDGGLTYIIHFVIETYACLTLFTITASVDASFSFYSSQIMGHFRALSYEMENLKFEGAYEEQMQDFVVRHQKLVKCCEILQDVHGPIVLGILLTTAVILCSLTFQISEMDEISIKQTILFTVYISVKLAQTLVYAWSGEMIAAESENFRSAVYACGWEETGKKSVGQYVQFILMQKPIVLQACKYTTISAQLFASIMNTTISYFFLLQTISDD